MNQTYSQTALFQQFHVQCNTDNLEHIFISVCCIMRLAVSGLLVEWDMAAMMTSEKYIRKTCLNILQGQKFGY